MVAWPFSRCAVNLPAIAVIISLYVRVLCNICRHVRTCHVLSSYMLYSYIHAVSMVYMLHHFLIGPASRSACNSPLCEQSHGSSLLCRVQHYARQCVSSAPESPTLVPFLCQASMSALSHGGFGKPDKPTLLQKSKSVAKRQREEAEESKADKAAKKMRLEMKQRGHVVCQHCMLPQHPMHPSYAPLS